MTITYHMHGGYYNDGNSHYFSTDTTIDLTTGITTDTREDTYGGQMASKDTYALSSHVTHGLTVKQQTALYETLKPFVELKQKYPRRECFQYFSKKQQYFYTGRVSKALEMASNSDYCGIDNLAREIGRAHV